MGSIPEAKFSALTEHRNTCVHETWPLAAPHTLPSTKQNPGKSLINPISLDMVCGYVKGLGSPRRNPGVVAAAGTMLVTAVPWVWFISAHL